MANVNKDLHIGKSHVGSYRINTYATRFIVNPCQVHKVNLIFDKCLFLQKKNKLTKSNKKQMLQQFKDA